MAHTVNAHIHVISQGHLDGFNGLFYKRPSQSDIFELLVLSKPQRDQFTEQEKSSKSSLQELEKDGEMVLVLHAGQTSHQCAVNTSLLFMQMCAYTGTVSSETTGTARPIPFIFAVH